MNPEDLQVNQTGAVICQCPDCGKRFAQTADLLALSNKDREVILEILERHFGVYQPIPPTELGCAGMTIGGLAEYVCLFSKNIPVRLQMVVRRKDGGFVRIAFGDLRSILGPTAEKPVLLLMATEDEP